MARTPRRGWESPPEADKPTARPARGTAELKPSGGTVRRGGSPIWPLLVVLLLLGAAAFAAVSWLSGDRTPETAVAVRQAGSASDAGSEPAADPDGEDSPVTADVAPAGETAPAPVPPAPVPAAPSEPRAAPGETPPREAGGGKTPPAEVARATPEPVPPPTTAVSPPPPPEAPAGGRIMEGPMLVKETPPAALAAALAALEEAATPEHLAVVAEHAEAGWPEAQTALGLQLARGDVVARDFKQAVTWFEKAAAGNDAAAQYYLGYAHLTGDGVQADKVKALAWFIVAASRGQAEALAERDRGLANLAGDDRARAFIAARNLSADIAAGWSRDPASGVAVWLPSWFRDGSYALRVEVPAEDGYAHGIGKVVLKASQAGDSDRTFEGRFFRGRFYGERVREEEIHFLDSDDFLVRLPGSPRQDFAGIDFWLRTEYGVQIAADPCYVATNRRPDLLVAVPEGFPVLDDKAAEQAMHEGWRLYQELCPEGYYAEVYVVPAEFRRQRQRSRMIPEYSPLFARASFYGKRGEQLSVGQFENLARRAHEKAEAEAERQRQRQAREDKRRRAAEAAGGRGNPDVRGLRLGMTLAEVRALFEDEIAAWEPPWRPERLPAPFRQFSQNIRLADGAKIEASFTSAVNGSLLYAFVYEQNLRDGIDRAKLTADLEAKYGKPDDYGTGGIYWSYKLVSRKPEETLGAFMKVTIRSFETGPDRIDFLRLVINDAGFGSYDERAAYAAEREEKARQYEANKSRKPKF